MKRLKPLLVTWLELHLAMMPLHQNVKADVDRLHDIWLLGAPTPNSRILNMAIYDPRLLQAGNYECRIVFPTQLAKWIVDVSARRGYPYTWEQAINLTQGQGG